LFFSHTANILLFWILRFVYSPSYASLADLSIAAQQRGKTHLIFYSLFAACGREGGRAKQDRVSKSSPTKKACLSASPYRGR